MCIFDFETNNFQLIEYFDYFLKLVFTTIALITIMNDLLEKS